MHSFHPVNVIKQEIFYSYVEETCLIVPANDVISHNHNLHERVVDFL